MSAYDNSRADVMSNQFSVGDTVHLPDGSAGIVNGVFPCPMRPDTPYLIVQPAGDCGEQITIAASEVTR